MKDREFLLSALVNKLSACYLTKPMTQGKYLGKEKKNLFGKLRKQRGQLVPIKTIWSGGAL